MLTVKYLIKILQQCKLITFRENTFATPDHVADKMKCEPISGPVNQVTKASY